MNGISFFSEYITKIHEVDDTYENDDGFNFKAYNYERSLFKIIRSELDDLDPMHLDYIVGDLGILQFQLNDTTFEGTKTCKINEIK